MKVYANLFLPWGPIVTSLLMASPSVGMEPSTAVDPAAVRTIEMPSVPTASSAPHLQSATAGWNTSDVPVTPLTNTTQTEPSVFVNPVNPSELLVSCNSEEFPFDPNAQPSDFHGANHWVSTNYGVTWQGSVNGVGGENRGDPATAIGLDQFMHVGYIDLITFFGQSISNSTNHGTSWARTPVTNPGAGELLDKNHLWVDNGGGQFSGTIYSAWSRLPTTPCPVVIKRSLDGGAGLAWSSAYVISPAPGSTEIYQGVNIQTGPNGEVYLVWAIYPRPQYLHEEGLGFARSLDGGQNFSAQVFQPSIFGLRRTYLGGGKNMYANSFPSMTVNQQTGQIFVVWTNLGEPPNDNDPGDDPDIYMVTSTNQGSTWSAPMRINQDDPAGHKDQWFPWIVCDPVTGILACIYYDSRNFANNDATETFVALSRDNGVNWIDFLVSDYSWSGDGIYQKEPNLWYCGDYIGIAARNSHFYPTWMATVPGETNYRRMVYVSHFEVGRKLAVPSVYPNIQAAVDAANPWDTILVAAGPYSGPGNYNVNFNGKEVAVVGSGGATLNLAQSGGSGFILNSGEGQYAAIKGLTIEWATEGAIRTNGSPRIESCTFRNCLGNGAAINVSAPVAGVAAPVITGCVFEQNVGSYGGAVYLSGLTKARIGNCTFRNNEASIEGGALYSATDPGQRDSLYNCVFDGNHASGSNASGAALYIGGNAYLKNNTFVRNYCDYTTPPPTRRAVVTIAGSVTEVVLNLQNVANNSTYGLDCRSGASGVSFLCNNIWHSGGLHFNPSSSCTQGGLGPSNISADPLFCNLAGGVLTLHWNSPCSNGNNPTECMSAIGALDVDYACGPAVTLVSPPNGFTTSSHSPTLTWTAVGESGAEVTYDVQVDNNSDFSSPERNVAGVDQANWVVTPPLMNGTYNWRVRYVAHLPGGGDVVGSWSSSRSFTTQCMVALTGDVNESGTRTTADIVYLINYVLNGSGPAPLPCPASGDVNCSGTLTSADIIYMVNFVLKGGPAPCDVCTLIDQGAWTCP